MLFNSFEFLLFFLPLTLVVYSVLIVRVRENLVLAWLLAMSLLFYAWWNPNYLLLLVASITVNYQVGKRLAFNEKTNGSGKTLLTLGVVFNLLLLAYFKYADFFLQTVDGIAGLGFAPLRIVLPLAISFFTFQQIAFLVDAYQGKVSQLDPLRYSLFVAFFPQLIAGPIVHHAEIFPQLANRPKSLVADDLAVGLSRFALGLFKKVILADSLAHFVDLALAQSAMGVELTSLDYLIVVVAFSLQIYFDFSAYSDMAIGLGRMFSIRLPENFLSPYQATSIIEFWRRWHITLSRFLKDYLYIPLGGSRKGRWRRFGNLMVTMCLGGLWHGAQWHFVFWGFLHGLFLMLNHAWRKLNLLPNVESRFGTVASQLLVFLLVSISWVYFRADSVAMGNQILVQMVAWDSAGFSPTMEFIMLGSVLLPFLGWLGEYWLVIYLLGLMIAVMCLPNCQQLFSKEFSQWWSWRTNNAWAGIVSFCLLISVLGFGVRNEFIYFQF